MPAQAPECANRQLRMVCLTPQERKSRKSNLSRKSISSEASESDRKRALSALFDADEAFRLKATSISSSTSSVSTAQSRKQKFNQNRSPKAAIERHSSASSGIPEAHRAQSQPILSKNLKYDWSSPRKMSRNVSTGFNTVYRQFGTGTYASMKHGDVPDDIDVIYTRSEHKEELPAGSAPQGIGAARGGPSRSKRRDAQQSYVYNRTDPLTQFFARKLCARTASTESFSMRSVDEDAEESVQTFDGIIPTPIGWDLRSTSLDHSFSRSASTKGDSFSRGPRSDSTMMTITTTCSSTQSCPHYSRTSCSCPSCHPLGPKI